MGNKLLLVAGYLLEGDIDLDRWMKYFRMGTFMLVAGAYLAHAFGVELITAFCVAHFDGAGLFNHWMSVWEFVTFIDLIPNLFRTFYEWY